MVTTKQAQQLLEDRGISVSYPTIAQWTREGKFKGAERKETERGPVWYIPVDSIKAFEPPKVGRPAEAKPEQSNSKKRGKK
ncbi:MAG: hypothetical protein H0W76_27305 [Pyrinomonadaceae bacterium]|nr:hypothetical protein [Pyrinomonadaceae bacterium]